jgi:hypothetical protein
LNTVEFAVEDGVPYAIDFMNPAPDADLHSVGRENFEWIVDRVSKLAVKKALNPVEPELRWAGLLSGTAKAATKKVAAKKSVAKKVSEDQLAQGGVAKKVKKKAGPDEIEMAVEQNEPLK